MKEVWRHLPAELGSHCVEEVRRRAQCSRGSREQGTPLGLEAGGPECGQGNKGEAAGSGEYRCPRREDGVQ